MSLTLTTARHPEVRLEHSQECYTKVQGPLQFVAQACYHPAHLYGGQSDENRHHSPEAAVDAVPAGSTAKHSVFQAPAGVRCMIAPSSMLPVGEHTSSALPYSSIRYLQACAAPCGTPRTSACLVANTPRQ